MKILDYLYYRLYCLAEKTNANDIAEYAASLWFVGLLGLNIIVIVGNLGFNPLNQISSKRYALILFIPLMTLMYFLFFKGEALLIGN